MNCCLVRVHNTVTAKGAGDRIQLRRVEREQRPIIDVLRDADGSLDFCMCNPPFFARLDEANGAAHVRACTGNADELLTDGGEARFAERLVEDSAVLRDRVRWYTCMLGHRSSVRGLAAAARHSGAKSVYTTEFCQGQTVRWGVAWSFTQSPPSIAVHRLVSRLDLAALRTAIAERLSAAAVAFQWRAEQSGTREAKADAGDSAEVRDMQTATGLAGSAGCATSVAGEGQVEPASADGSLSALPTVTRAGWARSGWHGTPRRGPPGATTRRAGSSASRSP